MTYLCPSSIFFFFSSKKYTFPHAFNRSLRLDNVRVVVVDLDKHVACFFLSFFLAFTRVILDRSDGSVTSDRCRSKKSEEERYIERKRSVRWTVSRRQTSLAKVNDETKRQNSSMESNICLVRCRCFSSSHCRRDIISRCFSNHLRGQDTLNVDVYDEDSLKDEKIGSVRVNLNELYDKGSFGSSMQSFLISDLLGHLDQWYDLTGKLSLRSQGQIHLVLDFERLKV